MNALSRREEETLLKTTKTRALKECDDLVKGEYFNYAGQMPESNVLVRLCRMCDGAHSVRCLGV